MNPRDSVEEGGSVILNIKLAKKRFSNIITLETRLRVACEGKH